MSVDKSRKCLQKFQAFMLGLFSLIHKLAESSFWLENRNVAYDTELWNGDHHVLSLSSYSRHLETDTKVLSSPLEYFICFKKSTLLENNLLTNSLLSWELDLMSGIFSRQFLKLGSITIKFYLNLILPLL